MKMRMVKRCFVIALISVLLVGCGASSNELNDNKTENKSQEDQQDTDISDGEEAEVKEETGYDGELEDGKSLADEDSDEMAMQEEQENSDLDIMSEDSDSTEVVINTEYIPIAYRENALLVQRSEDIELYGLLDNRGNIVIEPEYDELSFKFMNGKDYIKATLAGETGILDLEGKECIELGKYDDIVSAGDAGWLALNSETRWENMGSEYVGIDGGKQYLLDEKADVIKEFSGTYEQCFGNKYLLRSKIIRLDGYDSYRMMHDSEGGETCEVGEICEEIYDLDENLLLSSSDGIYLQYLLGGDMLAATIVGSEFKLLDMGGNVISNISDEDFWIIEPMMDEQKLILCQTSSDKNLLEFDLTSGIMTETEFHYENEWDAQIIEKKSGDFYQLFKDGDLLFDERFAECSFRHGVLWLKNIDSEWGIADYDGNILIPFGGIVDEYSLSESGGILESRGMFGFYRQQNGNFEFHNFIVPEGRLP